MIHYVIWIRFSQVHARIRGSFLIEICWSILHYEHLILFCILHIIIQPTCQVFEKASRKGHFAQIKKVVDSYLLTFMLLLTLLFFCILKKLYRAFLWASSKMTNLKNRENPSLLKLSNQIWWHWLDINNIKSLYLMCLMIKHHCVIFFMSE